MAPKLIRSLSLFASVLMPLLAAPGLRVHADGISLPGTDLPSLGAFAGTMIDGQAAELRGLYVPNILADTVVQQPGNDGTFVSTEPGTVTQFRPASAIGSIGLLAHNFLAGAQFLALNRGQLIYLVYGDGRTMTYVVSETLQYQALDPDSAYSNFIDLASGTRMSASTLFNTAYGRPGDVVLQTCIDANGDPSWGRLFIVAEPYAGQSFAMLPAKTQPAIRMMHIR